jgi:magnesium chelatase accessory protein
MSDAPDWSREGRGWPNADHSRFVAAGGLTWHVQVAGSGPVLLLLHGTGAATHSWRDLLPLLTPHFTVVAPDLPGHGFTRGGLKDGPTLPGVARAVAALLGELDMDPTLIAGHSAGAAIGLRMLLDGLVKPGAFVALSPALLPFPGLAAQLFPTLAKMLFLNPFAPHIFARMAGPTREVERFMLKSTGSTIDAAGIEFYARLFRKPAHIRGTISMMASWDLEPLKRDLPRIAVPVRVLHGDRDAAIPMNKAREAAALIQLATFERLERLGHLAHEEDPGHVAGVISGG